MMRRAILAAVLMASSSLIVILNSLRLEVFPVELAPQTQTHGADEKPNDSARLLASDVSL